MKLDSLWIKTLAKKYGKRPKEVRDALWPGNPNAGLSYFDKYGNPQLDTLEVLVEAIGCSFDELVLRETPYNTGAITGNNNKVGNVNINSDVKSLKSIIQSQKELIEHQVKILLYCLLLGV